MQRRTFLKAISLSPLIAINNSEATVQQIVRTKLGAHPVAGYQFYDGVDIWPQLQLRHRVNLEREYDNDIDEDAINVYWQHYQLGYIPHQHNALLSRLMDDGHTLSAEIIALKTSHDPWQRIKIAVYLET